MKLAALIVFLFTVTASGQKSFRLNDASKSVDVVINIGKCESNLGSICGPVRIDFLRKGKQKPFQSIGLPRTSMWDPEPKANITRRYDDQSTINFGDFNFDGAVDVAICDGTNGGYGMPSYRVYIYSKSTNRFLFSRSFTKMNYGGLGMFETDQKKKMHFVFTKSGCCWHQTQGYDVFHGRPRKVYELIVDGTKVDDARGAEITTSKLIKGRWRIWIKHVK